MAYRKAVYAKSTLKGIETLEGETIEQKMERVIEVGEPISDGAPEIFTERKDGVAAGYNIRTDRWEIACEAMDKVAGSIAAKRDNVAKMDVVKDESKDSDGTKEVGGQ